MDRPPNLEYQIPIIDPAQLSPRYRSIPVNFNHPKFNEPLIPLKSVNVAYEGYYAKTDGNNPPYDFCLQGSTTEGWLRKTVAEKLAHVNQRLQPFGVELLVLDAHRSVDCQQSMWNFHYAQAQANMPNAPESEWCQAALHFASPPVPFDPLDSTTWLTHMTGAAADLVLRELTTLKLCNMGSNFEEITEISCTDYFERQLAKGLITKEDERLQNRRLLHWAMAQEDMINDIVYWHYDWGNQLYIRNKKVLNSEAPSAAWYGYIEPPSMS